MIAAARIARATGQVLLGLMIWPFLLPLGVKRICRIARRLVRKLAKPAALWWNAWELQRSLDDERYFESFRAMLAQQEQNERVRQMRLHRRRREISGW